MGRVRRAPPLRIKPRPTPITQVILGIRRTNGTDGRCPIMPDSVKRLVRDGVRVLVQPCPSRVIPMARFLKAGAESHLTLEPAHITIGLENQLDELLVDSVATDSTGDVRTASGPGRAKKRSTDQVARTHLFVSQASHRENPEEYENSLQKFTSPYPQNQMPTLIDFALLKDRHGTSLTVHNPFNVGAIGTYLGLLSTAVFHKSLGVLSPFLIDGHPEITMQSVYDRTSNIAKKIENEGTPEELGPFIVGVTGARSASLGALKLLTKKLPSKVITMRDLPDLLADPSTSLKQIYVLHAMPHSYLIHPDSAPPDEHVNAILSSSSGFTWKRYLANPLEYRSYFSQLIAPYLTLLVNGASWQHPQHRVMSNLDLKEALEEVKNLRSGPFGHLMLGRCRTYVDLNFDDQSGLSFVPPIRDVQSNLSCERFINYRPPSVPEAIHITSAAFALPFHASRTFSRRLYPYLRILIREIQNGYWPSWDEKTMRLQKVHPLNYSQRLRLDQRLWEEVKGSTKADDAESQVALRERLDEAIVVCRGKVVASKPKKVVAMNEKQHGVVRSTQTEKLKEMKRLLRKSANVTETAVPPAERNLNELKRQMIKLGFQDLFKRR